VIFAGNYQHTIDRKGRLAIPADIRAQWRAEEHGAAWFAVPVGGGVIRLYTEAEFRDWAQSLRRGLTPSQNAAELNSTLFGLSSRLEMDAAGRIRVPEEMLGLTGLGSEVALVGAGGWLEIRDRKAWLDSIPGRLRNLPDLIEGNETKQGPARGP